MNEYNEFKNFITRRYTINYYPSSMRVTDKEVTEFEKKYSPEYKNSPLKLLRHLGRAFADKMIPYIESKSDELNNIETLTIKILKQIANEANEEFNKSVYEIQEPTDNFEQDKQTTIRKGLNKLFRTNHHISPNTIYTFKDFINCGNNGEIHWLYFKNPDKFVINKKEFEKEVSQIVGENMDYKSILNEIEIPTENISPKVIYTNRGNTRGFEISFEELSNNMFDMHIPFGENT